MWLEEKQFADLIHSSWKEIRVERWMGSRLSMKLKILKQIIKKWIRRIIGEVQLMKSGLMEEILILDGKAEVGQLLDSDRSCRQDLGVIPAEN